MRLCLFFAGVLAYAVPAQAESLQAKLVSKDARWLIHIDIEKILSSPLFRALPDDDVMQAEVSRVEEQHGWNALEDMHALTAYSAGEDPRDAVLMMVLSNAEQLIELLRQEAQVASVEVRGESLLRIEGDTYGVYAKVVPLEGENHSVLVAAEKGEVLAAALDVLSGESSTLADEGAELKARPGDGSSGNCP